MTEYDYSPEGYQRYLDTQRRISKWVQNTNAHASEFRSPFGLRSEFSLSGRTSTSSKTNVDRMGEWAERGRRNSTSDTTLRQNASGTGLRAQRSPTYAPHMRHSYPYSPASRESHAANTTTHTIPAQSYRRAQSLASRPSHSESQPRSSSHHRTSSHSGTAHRSYSHGYQSPRRSSTLPAYVVVNPQQSTHVTHSTPHPSSSHRSHHHHHHHHSRSQSASRSSSKTRSPLAISPAYTVAPGGYIIVSPKGRKVNVVYT